MEIINYQFFFKHKGIYDITAAMSTWDLIGYCCIYGTL